jgi:hypothetical protein
MTSFQKPSYCNIYIFKTQYNQGEGRKDFYKCRVHGDIVPIMYIERIETREGEFVGLESCLACALCLGDYYGDDPILPAVVAEIKAKPALKGRVETCDVKGCDATTNLEDCKECGLPTCPVHMIEGTCVSCATMSVSGGWYGA